MINGLYTFSPGSFVVADEWNANFSTLNRASQQHQEVIQDANNSVAFPNSDLSNVFNAIKTKPNSSYITGNTVSVYPQQEYYKTLSSGQDLTINIPLGMESEARILIQIQENRSLLPFSINYSGTTIINHYNNYVFRAGYYYIMIYETNGLAQVKLIWTGA